MRSRLDFAFADFAKAIDGWLEMTKAMKLSLREEIESGGFPLALFQAVCGCALLTFVFSILSVTLFALAFNRAWDLLEQFLLTPISQHQVQDESLPQI